MRLLVLITTFCLFSATAHARIGEVMRAFNKPNIQFVVLRFVASACRECKAQDRRWKALKVDQERLWIIEVADQARCAKTPDFVDQSLCTDEAINRRRFGIDAQDPKFFLWDVWGQLREVNSVQGIEDQMAHPHRPPLTLHAPKEIRKDILRAIAKDALYQPARGEPPGLELPRCTRTSGPGPYSLSAKFVGEKVKLQLQRGHCIVKPVTVSVADTPSAAVHLTRSQLPDPTPPRALPLQRKAQTALIPLPAEAKPQSPVVLTRGLPAERLASFAAGWTGVRYQRGGLDHHGIDDTQLARQALRTSFGFDIGDHLSKQIVSGPEIRFDRHNPDRDLQPGDLLFYVSYAYLPRAVMVYLGGSKMLTSQLIRGVVIEAVPTEVPDYLYLVARRPTQGFNRNPSQH